MKTEKGHRDRIAEPNEEAVAQTGEDVQPASEARSPLTGLSGVYVLAPQLSLAVMQPWPGPMAETPMNEAGPIAPSIREELRLDVDGRYPGMVASGTIDRVPSSRVNWIANLQPNGAKQWSGLVWYKDGDVASFPYTSVAIKVKSGAFGPVEAKVTFSADPAPVPQITRVFKFKSPHFRSVDFEYDFAQGETAITSMQTGAHPNRPAGLPSESLSIKSVFQRAGFEVTESAGGQVSGAGPNDLWSDQEMHDAMQNFWSKFSTAPQWAMWVFFARLHDQGTSLGGIMFDDIGAQHRQGTAIFNKSFIATAPSGDPNPAAWVNRMIFWTACHEMGHAFNLAHSWQKSLGTPWIPLADEPEARSFMNYPFRVAGGQGTFFADFEFRFSPAELLFMRHAPERFVQMGNADWFDHHGFTGANVSVEPTLKLELRVNRDKPFFEFLEPVTLELKLSNVSSQPELIDDTLLRSADSMTIILKKEGRNARQFVPYAQYCWLPQRRVLAPGESIYESLFVSAGRNGWDLAEPGKYQVQVAVRSHGRDIVSNPLLLRVLPPREFEEERLGQDIFSDDVGRILSFDGSRVLGSGNDTLREVVDRLSDRKVSLHAKIALGTPLANSFKEIVPVGNGPNRLEVRAQKPEAKDAQKLLSDVLTQESAQAIETLGHIDYKSYMDRFIDWCSKTGQTKEARTAADTLYRTLSERSVHGRSIAEPILKEAAAQKEALSQRATAGDELRTSMKADLERHRKAVTTKPKASARSDRGRNR